VTAATSWPLAAWAADTAPASLGVTLANILVPLVTALAAWLVHRLVSTLEKKVGLELGDANYAKLMDIVDHGINFAAEQAAKAIDKKLESGVKLHLATEFVNDNIKKFKLDEMAQDQLQALIEARLAIAKRAISSDPNTPSTEKKAPL